MLITNCLGLKTSYPEELSMKELKQSRHFIFLKEGGKFRLYEGDLLVHSNCNYSHYELMTSINRLPASTDAWKKPVLLFRSPHTSQFSHIHDVKLSEFNRSKFTKKIPDDIKDLEIDGTDWKWRAAMTENVFITRPNGESVTFYCGYPRQTHAPATIVNLRDTGFEIKTGVVADKGEFVINIPETA